MKKRKCGRDAQPICDCHLSAKKEVGVRQWSRYQNDIRLVIVALISVDFSAG